MRKNPLLAVLLLSLPLIANAQETAGDKENDAVKRVVETYLYSEDAAERKQTLYPQAKIYSVDPSGGKVAETPVPKPAKKTPKRTKTISRQKIVSMDMTEGGASVKVETNLSSDVQQVPKHIQYLSLLKIDGEWKIVSILMPPIRLTSAASK